MWYAARPRPSRGAARGGAGANGLSQRRVVFLIFVLMTLMFSKNVYTSSLSSYFPLYLIERFGMSVQAAQVQLFILMAATAVGTLVGGPIGDQIGRLPMIWISIVGALPFTLLLPYADPFWTGILSMIIGMLMASAFPAILVYAQELVPGRVGMISGMFFGFAFGLGGLGAAVLGRVADATSLAFVYQLTSYLPALGLVTVLLPNLDKARRAALSKNQV